MGWFDHCTDGALKSLWHWFKHCCPLTYRLLCGNHDDCLFLKHALGFPTGALLGFALHYFVLSRLQLAPPLGPLLSFSTILALALGFSASVQVRCISLLVLPHFFGKNGRSYVMTFALTLLITGPIMNLMFNGREISRSMACVQSVLANQTKVKNDLRTRPVREVMMDMQKQGKDIDRTTKNLKKQFQPMKFEIQDDGEVTSLQQRTDLVDDTSGNQNHRGQAIENKYRIDKEKDPKKKDEKKYERKMDYRCEDIWNAGVLSCRRVFTNAERDCRNAMPVVLNDMVCWPMKLTAICEFVRMIPHLAGISCDSSQIVNEGFGEEFQVADEAAEAFDKNFEVSMRYKLEIGKEDLELSTLDDIRKSIDMDFQARQDAFMFVMDFVQRILAFVFIRVFLSANSYHSQFLKSITYDNHYVTRYFRHVDARRHKQNKRILLPLKRLETTKVISTTQIKLLSAEKGKLMAGTAQIFIRLLMFGAIYFIDHLIYTILYIIQTHSHIEYQQKGVHHVAMLIDGKGAIAHLIRSMFRAFNTRHTIDNYTTNFECLPRPRQVPFTYITRTLLVFLTIWLLMLGQAYALRLRRLVAAFFYPKREKRRVLYLYNDLLKKRKGYLKHMRRRVKTLARKRALSLSVGLLGYLRTRFPRLCCWIRCLGLGKRHCTVCKEKESSGTMECPSQECSFVYCQECWADLKHHCYACQPDDHCDETDDSATDDSEFDGV